jgi:tetratricopeptide (TPR) repeat protein
MTKFFSRASIAVLAAVLAAAVPNAAMAQKKSDKAEKAPSYKFSKPVQSLLAQAQTAQTAGDNAGALALLRQAEALPNKNADDTYMIAMMTLNAAIGLKDNALIEQQLEAALATGRISPEDQQKFIRNLGAMALQRNDVNKAVSQFERLMVLTPNDTQLMVEVAELQRRQGLNAKAIATLGTAIANQEKTGTKADESWYRRALAIAYDSKLPAEIVSTSEALVRAYPKPTNWRDVLIIFRDSNKFDDQGNLDILRLMRANNALAGERDYAEYAETASIRGLPGEAKSVVDEGVTKGALQASKPVVKEILASVNPKIAADRASLAGLERESMASKTGRLAMGTADAHLGYGNYAKAAELYRAALAKGGVDPATVNTRIGLALGRSGDKAGAEAALKAVTGSPRDQLAKYYLIWLAQQA